MFNSKLNNGQIYVYIYALMSIICELLGMLLAITKLTKNYFMKQ